MTYEQLVKGAQKEIIDRIEKKSYGNKRVTYGRCAEWENGDQINLWTYWQGYQIEQKEKGIDILLVGQDYGNPYRTDISGERIKRVQKRICAGEKIIFYEEKPYNATNHALVGLFALFGCDITSYDPGKRIFFTNYSLGYREGCSEQGGMTKTLMKQDSQFFRELVLLVKPKIIICLGRMTYECVTERTVKEPWTARLKEGKPLEARYLHDTKTKVYGVAHCGARGVNNIGGEKVNQKAWKKIADDYRKYF